MHCTIRAKPYVAPFGYASGGYCIAATARNRLRVAPTVPYRICCQSLSEPDSPDLIITLRIFRHLRGNDLTGLPSGAFTSMASVLLMYVAKKLRSVAWIRVQELQAWPEQPWTKISAVWRRLQLISLAHVCLFLCHRLQ